MPAGKIGPGDDVEAWCTRCRMNLEHRVIAVVGSSVERVHCLTCGGDHKYYPPKYAKGAEPQRTAIRISSKAKASKGAAKPEKASVRALGEWTTFMKDLESETSPRAYRTSESYEAGEFIEHPTFGIGKVLDIVAAEKMQVVFREGRKILLCNRGK